ncbi:MAG TPA: DUF3306 domain-containing protein [Burkholderiales bacterium]|nr:DUF3306 domain-containing protein [Burkholderiales bacterium]
MAAEKEDFLRRWSRLKKEAPAEKPAETPAPSLPALDKLTPESDFSGFMHPKVEDALRRVALKKLFAGDPHFNLPDLFEPYSGDWNIAEPISAEMLSTLNQARTLLLSDEEKQALAKQEAEAQPQPQPPSAQTDEAQTDEPGKRDA